MTGEGMLGLIGATIAALLGAFVKWLFNRAVRRVDDLEVSMGRIEQSLSSLKLEIARDYHNKSEVKEAVQQAVAPLSKQLDRIEAYITTPAIMRRHRETDDGN